MADFEGGGGQFGGGGASGGWDPLPTSGAKGPLVDPVTCEGISIGSQVLDVLGICCPNNPHLNYQPVISEDEENENSEESPTPGCENMLPNPASKNDPCLGIYFLGAVRTYHFLASTFGVNEECEQNIQTDNNGLSSEGSSGSWAENTVGGGGGAGAGFTGGNRSVGGGGSFGGAGASGRWEEDPAAAAGAEDTRPEICRKWHWSSPDYADLSEYKVCDPLLFGFLGRSGSANKNSPFSYGLPCNVDQKCLGTYSRWNLLADEFLYSKPDQIALGRYIRKIQEYYHGFSSHLINEITMERVKWRSMSFLQLLAAPFSLAFFLTGCGQPCYKCSDDDHPCLGHGEHALNLVIAALDEYWLTDRADKGMLWPNERLLVDYYGTIVRGPEPWIGWFFYIMFKEATCDYCGCILFCFFVECIGPWFMRYWTVSSVITFNQNDSIPQALPGKFIEFVSRVDEAIANGFEYDNGNQAIGDTPSRAQIIVSQATQQSKESGKTPITSVASLPIDYDHFTTDHVFIDGKVDFHKADLFFERGIIKARTLSSYINCNCQADDTVGVDKLGSNFQYATRTNCCGFYKDSGPTSASSLVQETNQSEEPLRHATFLGFRTPGSQDDAGYAIRNQAVKYHTHKTRPDVWRYNWLYVDIPDRVPINCTPAQTAFDSFLQIPNGYFEDNDPLIIMRKRVYFKSVLTNGELELHGGLQTSRPGGPRIDSYLSAFSNISEEGRFYPFVWCDRAITKTVKAPYNLYFKSGDSSFKTCKLNELLTDLEPGRYYFPNPYSCQASPRMATYNRSVHGGAKDVSYTVEDEDNFSKYFSTYLPMQFDGWDGRYENDLAGKLNEAKQMLGNPEVGSFARYAVYEGNARYEEYASGPIEEFPGLEVAKIARGNGQEITIQDYLEYTGFNQKQTAMREDQLGKIYREFKRYDSKWWPNYMR